MAEPSALAAIGRTPVPGGAPAGESATDDPPFEELRKEVLKDPVREQTDWAKVVKLASDLLEKRSKDFTAGAYLAAGLLETKGYAGLLDGLAIVQGLHETFWDNGFPPVPKRLRGRSNAIQWLSERAATWIERKGAQPADRDVLTGCVQVGNDLDKVLGERFTDGDVGVGGLVRAMREQLDRLPAPDAPAAPVAAASGEGAAPAPVSVAPASAADLEIRSQSDAQTLIFKTAAFLRQKEPASPTPYRLVRVFRWAAIAAAPPVADGKTQIIPPAAETVAVLRRAHDASDWAGLLATAEDAFRQGSPLWLDLQRFGAVAAQNLGSTHAPIRDAIVEEVRGLLRRLPSLPELRFKDDSPYADPETRTWLAEALGAEAPAAAAPRRPGAAATEGVVDPAALAQARGDARRLVKGGDFDGARELIAAAIERPGSPRGEFLVQLEVATLCVELGRDRIAVPILQALDESAQSRGLEILEPSLATRLLESLYRASKRLAGQRGSPPDLAARVEGIFARLCRVDPGAAAGAD